MDVYIGMDISLQTTHICAVDVQGKAVHEGRASSDVASLNAYFQKHGGQWCIKKMGLEAGQLSTHLTHGLQGLGWDVVCMDARHAHGVLKTQRVKTDKNDARGLAQLVRTGWYRAVYIKSAQSQAIRTLVQGRKQIVKSRQDIENHVRGMLKTFGVKLGPVCRQRFQSRVTDAIVTLDALIRTTLQALLAARSELLQQEKALDRQSYGLARKDEVCRRLMTIPGVGEQTSLTYRAEIDDPSRFSRSRDVGAHVGLTPRRYASGEIDRAGGISKCGNPALRSLLFEAAVILLSRSRNGAASKRGA